MRKIILNLAISLDGYISDKDGEFDWIAGHGDTSQDTPNQFSFEEFMTTVDTVVMGSKSYEDCVLRGLTNFEDKKIIVATSRELKGQDNVELVSGDIVKKIEALRHVEGKDIYLFGGAGLADTFIKENVIDHYIIGIIPTILGKGRRLFKGEYSKIDLHLDEFSVADGVTVMVYSKR